MNLVEKLDVNVEHEVKLAMPNEIFTMLLDIMDEGELKKVHLPFAYSYLYFVTYMYRYGKYEQFMATTQDFKEILGYDRNDKRTNYIVKEGGLLERMELLETTKDIPVGYTWQFEDGIKRDFVKIEYLDEMKEYFVLDEEFTYHKKQLGWTPRMTVKRPRFGYVSDTSVDIDDIDTDYDGDGTFYYADRTHIIDFRVFDFCMQTEDLGVTGFYIYSYLKHKNDLHKDGYDASRERLSNELGLSTATISRYRDALRKYNLIELKNNNETFCSLRLDELVAPTNIVNSFDDVVAEGHEYVKFLDSIKRGVSKKQDTIKYKTNFNGDKIIDIDLNLLPF